MSNQGKRNSEGALVVSKVPSNAIQPATKVIVTPARKKPKKETVEEDIYLAEIDKIIQRDFFPDLPKLRTQLEWLDAEKTNDLQKMREIHLRLRSAQNQTSIRTPATLVTPRSFTPAVQSSNLFASPFSTPTAKSTGEALPTQQTEQSNQQESKVARLDDFLAKVTSEDNASFEKIIDKQNELKRHKYAYLTNKEHETQLLLTDGNNNPTRSASVLAWNFTAKNQLMYEKDGVPLSLEEEKKLNEGPPKEILLENTRIAPSTSTNSTKEKGQSKDASKVDLDEIRGLSMRESGSPKVRGFGFVATPSPAPGVDASPFTTWGTIEGAPLLIDSSSLDLSGPLDGPTFKIPETSSRERLAHDLSDQLTAKKKKDVSTPKKVTVASTPSPHRVDMQLRASYSPKVGGVASSPFKVPIGTPKRTPLKSTISSSPKIVVTPKAKEASKSSNL